MSDLIKKYWHDPVWSKVIATAITGAAGVCIYFFDWWPTIRSLFTAMFDFGLSNSATPKWLLGILVVPWLIILVVIGYVLWNKQPQNQLKPSWYSYTTDTFFGIRWTWAYDDAGNIVKLFSFCSNCDFQIYPKPHHDFMQGFTHLGFHCENCGQKSANQPDNVSQFENRIIRHIQLKIRNNSWSASK